MAQQSRAPRPSVRLCISGSAGVGKTTLARKLANVLDIPFSSDQVRETIRELGHDAHRTMSPADVVKLCSTVVEKRTAFEMANESFVADTSSVDNAAFFLRKVASSTSPEFVHAFVSRCQEHVCRYTDAIILPYGGIAFEDDGVRNPDLEYQREAHAQIIGLYDQWRVPYLQLPADGRTLPERVEWVRSQLEV